MVTEVAVSTQTDPSMAGASALVALAACCGGRARVQVRHGWLEPVNVYVIIIANSAEGKSVVQEKMLAPLRDAETDMSMAGEMERLAKADEKKLAEATADRLDKLAVTAAAKAAQPDATDDDRAAKDAAAAAAKDARTRLRRIAVPQIPRLLADDVSPAALLDLLDECRGRVAIVSAEGGLLDMFGGRYAGENVDVLTKGHSGDPINKRRKNQDELNIRRPAVTLGLMAQPRVVEKAAANADYVGRGLLARVWFATPVSRLGSRLDDPPELTGATENAYSDHMKWLATEMDRWGSDLGTPQLDAGAYAVFRRIFRDNEVSLVEGGEMASPPALAQWAGKYVGGVIRAAGLFHLAEHGEAGMRNKPITADTVERAKLVGEYFRATAVNVFAAMDAEAEHGEQDRIDAAKWLSEYLRIEGPKARSSDAKAEARKVGISVRTLQRARAKLRVVIGYEGQPPVSTWTLP
jgi:replicative DNA helicase